MRTTNEINAGSMADIAFLLLIFFLVTTTMDVDTGITRKLPPLPPEDEKVEVRERNIFKVFVSKSDRLFFNNNQQDVSQLRAAAVTFLHLGNLKNEYTPADRPEKREKEIRLLGGTVYISKGIISLKSDRGTSYEMYIKVQNELTAAIRELRDELSDKHFGMNFEQLTDKDKVEAIQKAVPIAISEAEPENTVGN